jgi:hypothetical protein
MCIGCGGGRYQDAVGQTTCIDCAAGKSSAGAAACTACVAGRYQPNGPGHPGGG